ncbi:hypothetical protein [Levilactobacillus acidifarinae]|uniref:Glycosyl hydrolase family 8 n=1 Tax=Levilactobacillus acidifarinae DSM 19394 = JCM 15949 TaxID=1423715 RepID=A0A0R1LTB9_9LACO|nr:hypothetical protein [Levilactobacillus acidifarinae]KRK96452.1 hypothetical protein FD25_GL001948 [Levilactobacillus acidifarinae DSM 19394]GEO68962.1 hypothetical protein LAC03_08720 [Levilactobacillus acidifarinae]
MGKRIWLGLGGLLLLLMLGGCRSRSQTMAAPQQSPRVFLKTKAILHTAQDHQHQSSLAAFIANRLVTKEGLYTNYVDTDTRQAASATGHEMLSESAGMWLIYLARHHQFAAFRTFYRATVKTFGDHGQFSYRYDPRSQKRFAVNATLDDLRIIKALNLYDALSKTTHYRQAAANHFATLKAGALKDGKVYDYYNPQSRQTAKTSSLAYIDFKTLRFYEQGSASGRKAYQEQLKVVRGGYLGDVFPLYAASFNWPQLTYSDRSLNTSEALEVLLHLAEIGKLKTASHSWLQQQVKDKKLYNGYTTAGSVSDSGQSAANYALAAMVFATVNDRTNYRRAMALVWQDQVTSHVAIQGGIGNAQSGQSYSFNNLTALNAADY